MASCTYKGIPKSIVSSASAHHPPGIAPTEVPLSYIEIEMLHFPKHSMITGPHFPSLNLVPVSSLLAGALAHWCSSEPLCLSLLHSWLPPGRW